MQCSLATEALSRYVSHQISVFFPDDSTCDAEIMRYAVDIALQRLEICFSGIRHQAYCSGEQTFFSHLYSDQYLTFLWILANTLWKNWQHEDLATRVYYLNKALHSFDCMYSTELPDIFFVAHGVGTVLGRASYGNYLYVSTGCVVGAHQGIYPVLGQGVGLAAGASVIGQCRVGDYASIGSGLQIFKRDIAAGSVAYRRDNGHICVKPSDTSLASKIFRI